MHPADHGYRVTDQLDLKIYLIGNNRRRRKYDFFKLKGREPGGGRRTIDPALVTVTGSFCPEPR